MNQNSDPPGPLVHRTARYGGALFLIGAIGFVIGNAVTQLGWTHPYSLLHNYISDLGAVYCGYWPAGSTHYVCSPWHEVFNGFTILMGICFVLAALLIRSAFPSSHWTTLGLIGIVVAGLGAIGVGLFPEDVNLTLHSLSAVAAFLIGNLAVVALGLAMAKDRRWNGYATYTVISGVFGLVFLFVYLFHVWGPLGLGGAERLIVAPILLWASIAGIHVMRMRTFAPGGIGKTST
ncbi:MAG: DUF998 domain-containing protein [Thermoplasmata archaeon]